MGLQGGPQCLQLMGLGNRVQCQMRHQGVESLKGLSRWGLVMPES